MKKQVKQMGTQFGITFTMQERGIYGIEEGDIIDLSEMIVIKKEKGE